MSERNPTVLHNTEDKSWWLIHGEKLENRFVEICRLQLQLEAEINPAKQREGIEGFKGGLSADHYVGITGTSRATATRDLQELVDKGVLIRTGERKGTRHWLKIKQRK